jgi:Tol biopolymer transport system component
MIDRNSRLLFGECEFDPGTCQLRRNGEVVSIEPKALDLLELLLERAPRVVDKTEIFAIVWKDVAVTDNVLTRLIAQLRRALGDQARTPRYIETVAGMRFVPAPPLDTTRFASLKPQQQIGEHGFSGFAAYSGDGKSLAYASDRSGGFEIYVSGTAPGSTPTQLTSSGKHNIQPAWSPGGQFIAYHEMGQGGIWIVPSRGGVPKRVSDFGSSPSWSPDGRWLAFQSLAVGDINGPGRPGVPSTIWIVDSEGRTGPVRLTESGDPTGPHIAPAWWPDSKRIIFAVPIAGGRQSLWSVDINSPTPRRLSDHEKLSALFTISPRGDGIYFKAADANALWWMPVSHTLDAAGQPSPTGLSPNGLTILHLTMSGNGRYLSWTAAELSGNVWAASFAGGGNARSGPRPLTSASGMRYGVPMPSPTGKLSLVGLRSGSHTSLFLLLADNSRLSPIMETAPGSGP